jgi:glycosyltransferase involved in cell wall biosynthesis
VSDPPLRTLFINSGILGHRAVAGLMRDVAGRIDSIEAVHIDLSDGLTIRDRLTRRLLSLPFGPRTGVAANVDLRRWRQELNLGLLAARRLKAAERAGQFDVLHFHTQATAYASLRRLGRTPSIVSIDATQQIASQEAVSPLSRITYGPNIAHDRRVFRAAAAITVTSEWAARNLRSNYPDCRTKVHVMPYPVPPLGLPVWSAERRQRSDDGERPHVLFIGGDFPRKGGNDLLAAWRAGGFADRAVLDLVTDWPVADLPPGVTVIRGVAPRTAEWRELWRRADLFAMPTRHEAFGLVFQEAAAAGLPVVATAINAVPEIVVHGVTGLLVPPGDRASLVRSLGQLIDRPALRRQMGAAALARVERDGSPAHYADRLAKLIRQIRTQ